MGESQETSDTQQPTTTESSTSAARRVTNWATNLLATGIILIGGLVFGRQILEWWGQQPHESLQDRPVVDIHASADPLSSPLLHFGEMSTSLQRTMFEGDREGVFEELRARCRGIAQSAGGASERLPGPAEKRLLERVAQLEPIEQKAGKWQIFQLDGPVPLVVAVSDPDQTNRGESPSRVLSWGLGVHLSGTRWALFTLASEDGLPSGESGSAKLPVPPNSQRSMSLQSGGGDALVGFRSEEPVEKLIGFYEKWMGEHNWTTSSDWREASNMWHARYQKPGGKIVDVQLVMQTEGYILGLLSAASGP